MHKESYRRDFLDAFASKVNWKITSYYEAELKRKYESSATKTRGQEPAVKNASKLEKEAKDLKEDSMKREVSQQHAPPGEIKTISQIQREEAAKQYLKQQCQKIVLQDEIEKMFMSASVCALSTQNAAICKSLEMSSNKIDKYI